MTGEPEKYATTLALVPQLSGPVRTDLTKPCHGRKAAAAAMPESISRSHSEVAPHSM